MQGSELAPLLLGLGLFSMVGWTVWVIVEGRRRRERLKVVTDFNQRLLDKIGSARELGEFLQTEGGSRFITSLAPERAHPHERILRAVQVGIVLTFLGLALLLLGLKYDFEGGAFTVLGVISLGLGIGFVSSSGVAYRLSKAWGLLGAKSTERVAS